MTVAIVCIALLGLLLFGLGLAVSLARQKSNVSYGLPDDQEEHLFKVSRAHGNTAEYTPMLAVLMLIVGANDPPAWALWTMGLAVASRYAIAAGIVLGPATGAPHPLRFIGATGTYATGLGLSIAALLAI